MPSVQDSSYRNSNRPWCFLPDIVVSAKALGCGVPVGAIGTRGPATGVLSAGDHGTTYGSNPLAATAVACVFHLYHQYNILSNVNAMAAYLDQKLLELASQKNDHQGGARAWTYERDRTFRTRSSLHTIFAGVRNSSHSFWCSCHSDTSSPDLTERTYSNIDTIPK